MFVWFRMAWEVLGGEVGSVKEFLTSEVWMLEVGVGSEFIASKVGGGSDDDLWYF